MATIVSWPLEEMIISFVMRKLPGGRDRESDHLFIWSSGH